MVGANTVHWSNELSEYSSYILGTLRVVTPLSPLGSC